jgi:hypothetical protein
VKLFGAGLAQWCSAELWVGWSGVQFPAGHETFLFTTVSRLALGPTQPPIQWAPGVLSLGIKWPGMKLPTHLRLMLRSIMHGAIPPLPQYTFMAWCPVKSTGTTLPVCLFVLFNWNWRFLPVAKFKMQGTLPPCSLMPLCHGGSQQRYINLCVLVTMLDRLMCLRFWSAWQVVVEVTCTKLILVGQVIYFLSTFSLWKFHTT